MRYGQALGQNGAGVRTEPETRIPPVAAPAAKEIPYDYVATFKLAGIASTRVQDVINISTEGAFVAVAIGYSFIPSKFDIPTVEINTDHPPGVIAVNSVPVSGGGFPLNLLFAVTTVPRTVPSTPSVTERLVHSVAQATISKQGIDFKYSIVDSGTGRELQNQAIHNIAGLGSADGDRPFRPFAKPALFMPRSTIRIEVEEVSEGPIYAGAQLYLVLHGYKILGYGTGLP